MTLDDFLPYVLPYANGCPGIVANLHTRMAIIELCQKAMIWREYQTAIEAVALQTAYAYTPAANQQVCTLLGVTLDGTDVQVVDPVTGGILDTECYTGPYAYGKFTGFELRPAQTAGLDIVTYATVAPSLAATTVPDALGKYVEGIANGALARILAAKDKSYSDGVGAIRCQSLWDDAIASAKGDALTGFARTTIRTAQVRF